MGNLGSLTERERLLERFYLFIPSAAMSRQLCPCGNCLRIKALVRVINGLCVPARRSTLNQSKRMCEFICVCVTQRRKGQ